MKLAGCVTIKAGCVRWGQVRRCWLLLQSVMKAAGASQPLPRSLPAAGWLLLLLSVKHVMTRTSSTTLLHLCLLHSLSCSWSNTTFGFTQFVHLVINVTHACMVRKITWYLIVSHIVLVRSFYWRIYWTHKLFSFKNVKLDGCTCILHEYILPVGCRWF